MNNNCYKWFPANNLGNHIGNCYNNRGTLLQVSPQDPTSQIVALAMGNLYGKGKIYAGNSTLKF